ncbi:MAG: glutamate racemase [Verrucomicrobiota bacterium]|mgnify:CR=1 FL=1|nr:glutamate racemase [Verrucomicrobiota bacterium]
MKNHKPIGVFDSGVGGLTVVRAIRNLLPSEDIIYLGDMARVPYGNKSKEAVTRYSSEVCEFLQQHDVKMIVVACNTASALALDTLSSVVPIPVLGMIKSGASAAALPGTTQSIGVIATQGTIDSGAYEQAIQILNSKATVFGRACPLLVPLVEEGWLDHPVTRLVLEEYLLDLLKVGIDTLVLGCTHYPLLKSVISSITGPHVRLVDSAEASAQAVKELLVKFEGLNQLRTDGMIKIFTTDKPEKMECLAQTFLGNKLPGVEKVTLPV